MHTIFRRLSFMLVLLMACLVINAQGYLKADGKKIINDKGEFILRGMGLGGWMLQEPYMLQATGLVRTQGEFKAKIEALIGKEKAKQFYETWLTNHCSKADIDSLAAWGFNSVRLPLHYNLFTLPVEEEPVKDKNTWLEKGFALTDSLLKWCKANRIYVILDLHAAPGGQGNDISISDRDPSKPSLWESVANQQKTIELWKKLAKRYVNEPWIGGYDLINEPNWGFTDSTDRNGCAEKNNAPLRALLVKITNEIRKIDKKHLIFIEGNCWANNYNGIFPLWDANMVISFHKYWNDNEQSSVQNFIDKREQYNVPIWMGESGENSNVWFTSAIALFEKNKIGWTWWPLKKMGYNNPLQVKQNKGYQQILAYWKGEGEKPSAMNAFQALMQLANDTKTENNIYHHDVVDAMFRQVNQLVTVPFRNNNIADNKLLYATDYDLGRNGEAYLDMDSADYHVVTGRNIQWNQGHQYRNDAVDIEPCTDSLSNGYNVGWTEPGEWLQYTIYADETAVYDIDLRTASKYIPGRIDLIVNDTRIKNIELPLTNGYQSWQTSTIKNISLVKGENKLRVYVVNGGFNLNYLQFNMIQTIGQNNQQLK